MKKALIYYSFIVITVMTLMGFIGPTSLPQLISAVLFFPLVVYFGLLVAPEKKQALTLPIMSRKRATVKASEKRKRKGPLKLQKVKEKDHKSIFDKDRRTFLKLIGSGGLSVLVLSIFGAKSAQAAFFGSVPGPGVVSLKDIAGNQIDPSEKQPTDGYKIAELDDGSPAYYGFVNKTGYWFIIKEDPAGTFRYENGGTDTDFATNWTGRAGLTYGYFGDEF